MDKTLLFRSTIFCTKRLLSSLSSASSSLSFNNHALLNLKSFPLGRTHDSFPFDFSLFISISLSCPKQDRNNPSQVFPKTGAKQIYLLYPAGTFQFYISKVCFLQQNYTFDLFPDWIEIRSLDASLRKLYLRNCGIWTCSCPSDICILAHLSTCWQVQYLCVVFKCNKQTLFMTLLLKLETSLLEEKKN